MIVIAKKSTKRIIKGLRYEAEDVHNATLGVDGILYIKDTGWYKVTNFTDINGDPVPKVHTNRRYYVPTLVATDLKVGDTLVCRCDSYKTLHNGSKYEIEKLTVIPVNAHWSKTKMKFKGVTRSFEFSAWSFRKPTTAESRSDTLNELLNEQDAEPQIITQVVSKEKLLIDLLAKSIMDRNRHHLSIVDWGCEQLSMNKVKKSDYDSLMEMQLKDILSIIEE